MNYRVQLILLLSLVCGIRAGLAGEPDTSRVIAGLQAKYHSLASDLQSNQFHAPLYIDSTYLDDAATGEVYALLAHDFKQVSSGLASAGDWCELLLLHVNVKGCDIQARVDEQPTASRLVTLYVGRDFYQPKDDAYSMQYTFQIVSRQADYFQMKMIAADGPFGTSEYLLQFEAIPMGDNSTFMHLEYAYHYGALATVMLKGYLATLGRNKVGFSIKAYDDDHKPVYVKGIQGIVERNSMRYYLAIQAFLDSINDDHTQWRQRIEHGYSIATQFRVQLNEIEDKKYLKSKTRQFKARDKELAEQHADASPQPAAEQ